MRFSRTLLSLLFIVTLAMTGLRAQFPQGLGTEVADAVTLGSDWLAVDNEGVGGTGRVLISTDNGETFSPIYTAPVSGDQFDTIATDGTVVIVSGTDSLMYRTDTTVQPLVWQEITPPVSVFQDIRDLAHAAGTWIAVGDSILRSVDDGQTWTVVTPPDAEPLNAVTRSNGVWVAVGGGLDGAGYRSEDDGLTWQAVTLPLSTPALHSVTADGFGNVLAVGVQGTVLLSTDNGQSFAPADTGALSFSQDLNAAVSTAENTWWIGGQERTLFSLTGTTATLAVTADPAIDIQGLWLNPAGEVLLSGVEAVLPPTIDALTSSSEPVDVTLLPDTAGDEMFYTTDGSDPRVTLLAYTAPFEVTGLTTVRAVSRRDGVYSPVESLEIDAGEALVPFEINAIAVSAAEVVLTQDVSTVGYTYGLEYTANLLADPQVWLEETAADQAGTGNALTWTVTPVPPSPRFWRVVIVPDQP